MTFYGFLNMNKTEEMEIFDKVNGECLLLCHLFQHQMTLFCSGAQTKISREIQRIAVKYRTPCRKSRKEKFVH